MTSFLTKTDNIFGGENIFVDGKFVGLSKENMFSGNNYFDSTGALIGHTQENVSGGVDILSSTGDIAGHTQSFAGGQSLYDGSGSYSGFIAEHGDMTIAFDAAGGIEAMNMGGSLLGEIGLEGDSLLDAMTTLF